MGWQKLARKGGGFINLTKYLDYLEKYSNRMIFKLDNYSMHEPLRIDTQLIEDLMEFINIKKEIITQSELSSADFRYMPSINKLDYDGETKLLLISMYVDIINEIRKKEFIGGFTKYNEEQLMFKDNDLFSHVRGCGELLDYNIFSWGKGFNVCKYNNKFYLVDNYFNEELLDFIHTKCQDYKKFIRINPHYSHDKRPPIYITEEALRPVDPKWIKNLKLFKGQSTGGHYFLQPVDEMEEEIDNLRLWEYSVRKIRSLEIHAQRNNSGNLSMMIEEMKEDECYNQYYSAKCIHLDTDDTVGTLMEGAVLNHIDLAINVYDRIAYKERMEQSLSNGRVIDATFRRHILRLEKVPFKILINLSHLFFDGRVLTQEWISEQFFK